MVFFLARVRCMVRAQNINHAGTKPGPNGVTMVRVANRRVHLAICAKLCVAFRCRQREVMRRHLHRYPALMIGNVGHLSRAGNVQHMDTPAMLFGKFGQLRCRHQGGSFIAPDGMGGRVSLDTLTLALLQPVLVLGVDGDPARGELKKKGHLFSVIVTPTSWKIMKHVDKDRREEDPNETLATEATEFKTGQWYALKLVTSGTEVKATIDGKQPLQATHPTFGVNKPTLVFRCIGDGVEIDDLRVTVAK